MPAKRSAGILLFRRQPHLQVLIGHLGGPLWSRRDTAAWSIPKGEYGPEETPLDAARREFTEELGLPVPAVEFLDLGTVKQSGGKQVTAWAAEADLDLDRVVLGTFELEWPPGSGRFQRYPELDRVAWFDPEQARDRLIAAQREFLDRLVDRLTERLVTPPPPATPR
ncbi:NUDIX domain-containing protein [Jatrophihabitans sp.]|jgi:predicted NUDIX family NTP pyrophosphohydrolase|uniref:NUDIX domain-containing protein n=1 Tax=Jatrophihabitans sp. TaxID=1932789 RepID=UPI002EF56A45